MTINVLAVDDSRTIRELVAMILDEAGMTATMAVDGSHGLDILDSVAPDVIITDINMPNLDGFGFIEAVKNNPRYANTPILVLTTESSAELKERARAAGATGWVVKPFDGAKLVRAVELVGG